MTTTTILFETITAAVQAYDTLQLIRVLLTIVFRVLVLLLALNS